MGTTELLKTNEKIKLTRRKIEKITISILSLCKERMLLAKEIGLLKSKAGLPIENSEAEDRLKKIVIEKSKQMKLPPSFGLKLLSLLIEESKNEQKVIIREKKEK